MNKHIAVSVLIAGTAWADRSASSNLLHTIHRFYGNGYESVADDMSGDRVSECAVPVKFLNKPGGWEKFAKLIRPITRHSVTARRIQARIFEFMYPKYFETLRENVRFWERRSFETAWSLEKNFYENRFDSFTNTLQWIQSDFCAILQERHPTVLFRVYPESILMTLIRLQEEKMPQRDWLSARRLDELFETRNSEYYQNNSAKGYVTAMTMVIISAWLSEYEKENGVFPRSLEEAGIPDTLRVDAWERPISYTRTDGRWFLLSLGDLGVAEKYINDEVDIDNNYPFFLLSFRRNLVLYSGLTKVLSEYYRTGKVEVGRFSFVRNPKTGSPATISSPHRLSTPP